MKKTWRDRLIEIVEWEISCCKTELDYLDWSLSFKELLESLTAQLWAAEEIYKIAIDETITDPIYAIEQFGSRMTNYSLNLYFSSGLFAEAALMAEVIIDEWRGGSC